MQIIQKPSGNTMKILGKPKASADGFRWMTYVLSREIEDGVLLFHTLTRELLLLTPEEYAEADAVPELREKWFRVPQKLDDRKYADQVRFVQTALRKKPKHIVGYTIFTTTDCNARCFYCFEAGGTRIPMTEETAHKAAAYMADHCGGKKIGIGWFGGEPLFNMPVIDIICSDLVAKGIEYNSSMISNGYLFDDAAVKQAVNLWKLNHVQITLDGTEEVYNRSKAYIYKDGKSPYQVVMANIGRLLNAGIGVTVRLNIDGYNADNLMLLADELFARFAGNKRFQVYSYPLYEFYGERARERTEETRSTLYEKQKSLTEKLKGYGIAERQRLNRSLKLNNCMADSGSHLTILPDGKLGLCGLHAHDDSIGHLDSEDFDTQLVQEYQERCDPIEACKTCVYYPECIRLKKCTELKDCLPEMRDVHRQNLLDGMQNAYISWQRKIETDEEENLPIC